MSSKAYHILGRKVMPGDSLQVRMDIARLHTRTRIEVPVIIERAKEDGPRLLISAGIHGNEVNGIEIVRQIISKGINKPERGMVICIPVVNIFGFLNQARPFPDGRDLNRVFPGSLTGPLASRFAYFMMKEITPHFDYCIDYHTGGGQRFNYTQIRTDGKDAESLKLAEDFGARFIIHAKERERSFREAASALGKKVLLFEGGKSLDLDKVVTEVGVRGAQRVMHSLKMRDFTKALKDVQKEQIVYVSDSSWLRAHHAGMFRSYVKLGSFVKKGQKLGSISDPFGEFERSVKARKDGYIICTNHSPIVNQGDALYHIAFTEE